MKSIMFCIGMVIYIGFAMADSAKTLQFNAVIDQQTLHECDIRAVSIVVHEQKKFISISLTRAGTKKATNFLRANKGKKMVLLFGDDALLSNIPINHNIPALAFMIEVASKNRSERIVASMRKIIERCGLFPA